MSRDGGPREDGRNPPPESEFKAFVGGISWHMNDQELKDTFRKYNARSASVMLDKMTGRSRGFGFVAFDNDEDLKEAVKNMHDSELDSRKISCTVAIPQSETAPGTPASALAGGGAVSAPRGRYGGGGSGGGGPRGGDRGYDRGYDRGPPRGYAARGYEDRRGYDRGGYGGYGRPPPERSYDRGGYGAPEYDRGYDRYGGGSGPPSYSGGYDRGDYGGGGGGGGGYGREPAGYSREGGYGAERGYGGGGGGGGGYADAGYGAERGGAYSSGYASGGGSVPPAYDRPYDDRGYGGRDAYSSRGPAAPVREGAYSRPGPEREYARPAARAPGPYERPMAGLPPR